MAAQMQSQPLAAPLGIFNWPRSLAVALRHTPNALFSMNALLGRYTFDCSEIFRLL